MRNYLIYSLRKTQGFTMEFNRAALRHGHIAAGLVVFNPRRNYNLKVGNLALHWGGVHLAHVGAAVCGLDTPQSQGPGVLRSRIAMTMTMMTIRER